jgi:hypothetical protein
MTNREWIAKGHTGCTFATLFAKEPQSVGWGFFTPVDFLFGAHKDFLMVSIEFVDAEADFWNKNNVKEWALLNGFYLEDTSEKTEGLRIKCEQGASWVQYFGPDSHVPTRRTPHPMLMFTQKLGLGYYAKVGFKGVLHLAHAWYDKISERVYDLLWERSYQQTKKKLGQSPDINSAAKTTWMKTDTLDTVNS